MVWNSASVTFLKICYYGRQWDLIWCNDTSSKWARPGDRLHCTFQVPSRARPGPSLPLAGLGPPACSTGPSTLNTFTLPTFLPSRFVAIVNISTWKCVYTSIKRMKDERWEFDIKSRLLLFEFFIYIYCKIYISFVSFTPPQKKKHASLFFQNPHHKNPYFDRKISGSQIMHAHNNKPTTYYGRVVGSSWSVLMSNIATTTWIKKTKSTHTTKNTALIRDGYGRVMKMVPMSNIATTHTHTHTHTHTD